MITAKSGGNFPERELVPQGLHVARCYKMIDLGTHDEEFQGVIKKARKVRIEFELPLETKVFKEGEDAKPFSIGKEFTLSLHEKAKMRKYLESWRGKPFTEQEANGFDVSKLIGAPCMVNIVHGTSKSGKEYADISAITPVAKGMTCPSQVNASFIFSFETFDSNKFEQLPDWIKNKAKESYEYKDISKIMTPPSSSDFKPVTQDDDESLPF